MPTRRHYNWKSQKHSFVILSDSEESDIIEILRCGVYPEPQILRRFAPQNDMGEGLLRMTLRGLFTKLSNLYRIEFSVKKWLIFVRENVKVDANAGI